MNGPTTLQDKPDTYVSDHERAKPNGFKAFMKRLFTPRNQDVSLKEVLEEAIQERSEDSEEMSDDERVILRNMLGVGDLTVRNVMKPRSDIIGVDYQITMTELKEVIAAEQHTRMPVFEESLDSLRGFIHLKDLVPALSGDEPFDIDHVLRDVMFIAPSMKIIDLLVKMRLSGAHMAIVVDEYGGTDGLVTLEDLFEALVGEIQDEHDHEDPSLDLRKQASNKFDIDARMRVEHLAEEIGLDLRELLDEEYDTLGGFIFAHLRRVPVTGEIIDVPDTGRIKVLDADPRRIRRVLLTLNYTPLTLRKETS